MCCRKIKKAEAKEETTLKHLNFENVHQVDVDEYLAAAIEDSEERHFTLDGQEVPVNACD